MMLIVWGYTTLKSGFDWIPTTIYLGGSLLWFFLYPFRYARSVERYSEKILDEGSGSKNFGSYELEFTESGIHSVGPSGSSTFKWEAVDRTSLTDSYLFIFLNGPIGYPIPIKDIGHDAAVKAVAYIESVKAGEQSAS